MRGWLAAYTANDHPAAAAGNLIALVIAWNQPFYPLYLWFILGRDAWIGLPDAASGILFFVIPAIARRSHVAGRLALPVVGVGNIAVNMWLFGATSGIPLFLFPAVMLAPMLFSRGEKVLLLLTAAAPLLVWLAMREMRGPLFIDVTPTQVASLFALNAISAASLSILLAWVIAGRIPPT